MDKELKHRFLSGYSPVESRREEKSRKKMETLIAQLLVFLGLEKSGGKHLLGQLRKAKAVCCLSALGNLNSIVDR